jgi:simple sugar transport system ATP-binding protein
MANDLLLAQNISKSFSGVQALRDVSIKVHPAEILCLIGENGSGKSTLIKIIAGVLQPDQGEIILNGRNYRCLTPINAIHEGVQVIYQDFSLFPNLTVAENIAFNYLLAKDRRIISWREIYQTAQKALGLVQMDVALNALVDQLSVAEKQLVAISRALLQNAKLIIMDEPTTALTQKEVNALFEVINKLKDRGISFLFVSHKLNEVQEISERIIVLRNGQKVIEDEANQFDTEKMTYYISGKHLENKTYLYQRNINEKPLLKIDHLSLKQHFSEVSFEVYPGEILGITGLLGSGRTDLALALFGVVPADNGAIILEGKPVRIRSIQDAIKTGIGYVPEDRINEGLFLEKPISSNIIVRLVDALKGIKSFFNPDQYSREAGHWANSLSIKTNDLNLPVSSLSGGNQQRVVLAKWLASRPKLLILNGPTVGVDIGSKAELHEIIRDLARHGMGLIVLSDDIPELLQLCNRIYLMRRGRLAMEFPRESIDEATLSKELAEQ